eukprot:CAMPEP_0117580462 /NCGR_PEP_ID=MMETSP0784-20121206/65220_1 /TAXON_ID=39447 /ORGANISM="" /LENGTH=46 /DNA_ID= /DNA_START= /DNA_END= /DNA_ORIENTATION=
MTCALAQYEHFSPRCGARAHDASATTARAARICAELAAGSFCVVEF